MYYTATEASTGDQCIGVATSTLPIGPYTDNTTQPVVCDNGVNQSPTIDDGDWGGSIDPDVFTDKSTGDSCLIWKSDGDHSAPRPPLSSGRCRWPTNLTGFTGTPTQLMRNSATWQSGIVEGPDMVETQTPIAGSNPPADTRLLPLLRRQ